MDCECIDLESVYDGKKIEDISELISVVSEVHRDPKTWETKYICKICAQKWLEKYEPRGHGEVPVTQKIK